ncbi:C6 zinc finger domain protein [Aspergillus bertholletiae]|uniref:C6 zinc finger domain protein n=1 Tax=Aspergillus bertholletiae TaxID=1226010 RepID=A0A5N7ASW9_9EURO|nr:C6 zinc finger domain protein [Aspergillus bertholletiae]
MPRAGPACLTCREKCRKCDRARPKCQRCISKGLVCGGYPEQFRFCGIASRGKWKGARIPVSTQRPRNAADQVNMEQVIHQQQASGTINAAPTPPEEAYPPPRSDKSHADTQEMSSEIAEILRLPETETLLTHYDEAICPHQISEIGNESDNPYRLYILPLARKQIGLLNAVLGLSALHLGQLTGNQTMHEVTAVEYRMKAIRALSEEIRRSQASTLLEDEQDAVLAIIQILLLHDIAESGISTHGIHITGAMSVCKRLLIAEGLSGHRQRAVFFLGNLAWLDIIRAFAGPERLCFSQDIRELVACASENTFEMVNGCPREVFLIIGGILEKSKEHTLGWLTWDEYQIAMLVAKHKLYSWDSKEKIYPSTDSRWLAVAEAFRYACILHILRLLDESRSAKSPEIQDCVARILDATSTISSDCPLIELLILPLFMAGADCLAPHSRYYILSRFKEIEGRSEIRNPVPRDLLEKVWAARAAQLPDEEKNISWTSFTHCPGIARQHDYLII